MVGQSRIWVPQQASQSRHPAFTDVAEDLWSYVANALRSSDTGRRHTCRKQAAW